MRVGSKNLAAEEAPQSYKVPQPHAAGCLSCNVAAARLPPFFVTCAKRRVTGLDHNSQHCLQLQDVDEVVETCEAVGISHKVVKLRPIAVVKG